MGTQYQVRRFDNKKVPGYSGRKRVKRPRRLPETVPDGYGWALTNRYAAIQRTAR